MWTLVAALFFSALPVTRLPRARAQEEITEDAAICLDYVSSVTADIAGGVLRIYGSPGKTYSRPVSVTESCTVILDEVDNDAELTVADGRDVCIVLRGNNRLAGIRALGGSATHVRVTGGADGGTLTAGDIACSAGGTSQTGAEVSVEDCSLFCRNLGCGSDGADTSAQEGSVKVAYASPGSNASPHVAIRGSSVSVSGSLACGGKGAHGMGTWSAVSSAGGCSGAVEISASHVTVAGNVAVGGKGGMGEMNTSYYNCKAGDTKSSSPVTITAHSSVSVAGSVAGQQDLPAYSNGGSQNGLHGVTVTVMDSHLTAKDIAGGGAGHTHVRYSAYSGSGSSYDITGTAGGNGGILVADNAVIDCERAVCGANAGDYRNYTVSLYGEKSGDVESARHPQDGRGGSIRATNSTLTIRACAAAKGTRWDGYPNPSVYGDSTFIGGTLSGTVYGNVITTDMTSIIGGGFAAKEIRNSEEASCAKCVLKTDEMLAGKTVQIRANALDGTVMLGSDGSMVTYLGIGKETVKLTGAGVYSGTFMVKRSESLNVFQLEPYGIINVSYDGALIRNASYTHTNETYDYDGDFTVRGSSEDANVTVEEGTKRITLEDTSFDTLNVNGASVVTLVLSGESHIGTVHVAEHAKLIIEGNGTLFTQYLGGRDGASGTIEISSGTVYTEVLGGGEGSRDVLVREPAELKAGESRVPVRDENGNLLYTLELVLGAPGSYGLRFNDKQEDVVLAEGETCARKLLAAGAYEIEVARGPFCFRGNVNIQKSQRIYLDDLTLYADVSAGDIHIRDGEISVGEDTIKTDAEIRITQSGEGHAVYVEKKTASIILDGVAPDIQIYLSEDFEGLVCDAGGRPVQIVTVLTGCERKELTLHLDADDYVLTTNEAGNLSILTGRGMHDFGLTIDGMTYRCKDAVSISTTEHVVRRSDMALVWDVSPGGITITDEGFSTKECSADYAGAYLIVQSNPDGADGMVTAASGSAEIFLSKEVDALLQVKVLKDFTGSVLREDVPLYPLVVTTNCTDSAVRVCLDGHEGMLRTDAGGKLYLIASSGTHTLTVADGVSTAILPVNVSADGADVSFRDLLALKISGLKENHTLTVTVGGVTAQVPTDADGACQLLVDPSTKEIIVSDGETAFRYPVENGMPGEPQPYEPGKPDSGPENPGHSGNTGGTGGSDSTGSTGGTGGSGSTGSSGGTDSSGSTGSSSESDASGHAGKFDHILHSMDGFGGRHPDGQGRIHPLKSNAAQGGGPEGTGAPGAKKPDIVITSSLKGVRLVPVKTKNTYRTYSRKTVRLTLQREKDTVYYYKIVGKGQKNSAAVWKRLDGKTITVKAASRGQRVFIKAIRDKKVTVKKTTGFMVDVKKPTVEGVKNAAVYKHARMVLVSDNGEIAAVTLNGKKMPEQFLVQKAGLYHLVVTDCAGNKKQVFFAVI